MMRFLWPGLWALAATAALFVGLFAATYREPALGRRGRPGRADRVIARARHAFTTLWGHARDDADARWVHDLTDPGLAPSIIEEAFWDDDGDLLAVAGPWPPRAEQLRQFTETLQQIRKTPAPAPRQARPGHGGEGEGRAFPGLNHADPQTSGPELETCAGPQLSSGVSRARRQHLDSGPDPDRAELYAQVAAVIRAAAARPQDSGGWISGAMGPSTMPPHQQAAAATKLAAVTRKGLAQPPGPSDVPPLDADPRWPWLTPRQGYSDTTGTFAAIVDGDQ
jgi:hypothetical protein